MAQNYKYVNLNAFPIFLPDTRGGQVMFRVGEATTQQWFSRFIGNHQLSRVRIDEDAFKPKKSKVPIPSQEEALKLLSQPPKSKLPTFLDEETKDYTFKNGVYACKLCGIFRTGSSESMRVHLKLFHNKPAQVKGPQPKLGEGEREGEKIIVSSRESVSQKIPKDQDEEGPSVSTSTEPVEPQVEEKEWACEAPGCNKIFNSKRGLSMHCTRTGHPRPKGM